MCIQFLKKIIIYHILLLVADWQRILIRKSLFRIYVNEKPSIKPFQKRWERFHKFSKLFTPTYSFIYSSLGFSLWFLLSIIFYILCCFINSFIALILQSGFFIMALNYVKPTEILQRLLGWLHNFFGFSETRVKYIKWAE